AYVVIGRGDERRLNRVPSREEVVANRPSDEPVNERHPHAALVHRLHLTDVTPQRCCALTNYHRQPITNFDSVYLLNRLTVHLVTLPFCGTLAASCPPSASTPGFTILSILSTHRLDK